MVQSKKQGKYANMREVAKRAEVSIATVSRYLNGGSISPAAKMSVQQAIQETDYVSNACAKGIFSNKYKTMGLMVSNMYNPFFTQLAADVEDYAYKLGYAVYLCITNDDVQREQYYIDLLKGFRVDGVITSRTICKDEYIRWSAPVVSFENEISEDFFSVSMNNYLGGWKVARALNRVGRSHLLHISGPDCFVATRERRQGFIDYCLENNLDYSIIILQNDLRPNEEFPSELKDVDWKKYDGIFVFNDITAALVMHELYCQEIQVPRDLSIIGFDDSYVSRLTTPRLSTVSQPSDEIAHLLVDALIYQIRTGRVKHPRVTLEPEIVMRESV